MLPNENFSKCLPFLAFLSDKKKLILQYNLNLLTPTHLQEQRKNREIELNVNNQKQTFLPFYASKNFE